MRSHFGPPALRPHRPLAVAGEVDTALDLDPARLRERFHEVSVTAVAQCAGAGRRLHAPRVPGVQWGHGAMGQARWTGVRLRDVLTAAGVRPTAGHVELQGADLPPLPTTPHFFRSIPLARALEPSTLLATHMNGEPLTLDHGAPLRLVVPGWAADHWTKWLTRLHVQREESTGFFMQHAYRMPDEPVKPGTAVAPEDMHPVHELPVKSVIARPAEGASAAAGAQEVTGVALSGYAPVEGVELSLDDGATWHAAALEGEAGVGRWQVFRHRFDVEPGTHTVLARARDRAGHVQPRTPDWNPSGYFWNGWHAVTWSAT